MYKRQPPVKAVNESNREIHKLRKVEQLPASWKITLDKGTISLRPFSGEMIEITFFPEGSLKADPSHSVIMKPGKVALSTAKTKHGYVLRNGQMTIAANADPFFLTYIYKGDTLLSEESGFYSKPGNTGVRLALKKGEKVYGTGERAIAMDRRGKKLPLYNRHSYGYEFGATQLNYSVPMTISSRKYAILFLSLIHI